MSAPKIVAIENGKSKRPKHEIFADERLNEALRDGRLKVSKTAKKATAPKATKAVAEPRTTPCLCGCGEVPGSAKARFLPGHDGRLKGRLLGRVKVGGTDGDAARAELVAFGWEKFIKG